MRLGYIYVNRKNLNDFCPMRINYDVQDLKAFCSLVRSGQFTTAAQELCITTSALSRRIAKIEEELGGKLFDRTTRSVVLTSAGRSFYDKVLPLLSQLDSCVLEASRLAQGHQGKLMISTVASVGYSVMPQVLPAFYERYPDVYISIRDGNATETTRLVEQREVDLGITTPVATNSSLSRERLTSYGFNLVFARQPHVTLPPKKIAWQDLVGLPVVGLNPLSSTRLQIDSLLDANDIALPWSIEVDHLATIIGLVQSGRFVTVMPGLFEVRGYGLKAIPIVGLDTRREVYLIKRRDSTLTPQAEYLAQLVRQHLA